MNWKYSYYFSIWDNRSINTQTGHISQKEQPQEPRYGTTGWENVFKVTPEDIVFQVRLYFLPYSVISWEIFSLILMDTHIILNKLKDNFRKEKILLTIRNRSCA